MVVIKKKGRSTKKSTVVTIFVVALVITIFLLMTILLLGALLNKNRESYIDSNVQKLYNDLNEMQTFSLLAEVYGDQMACVAFSSKLMDMDESIWNLGRKIDQYRSVSEEFKKNPYYLEQKKIFNENELFYMVLLKQLKVRCNYTQAIVLFFYQNSQDCKKCDDQSFVLTDINKDIDEELAIFSFDADLNLTSLRVLREFYQITELPCTIVNDVKMCGMQDKDAILKEICKDQPDIDVCKQFEDKPAN
ncbi:MAG: hypothetical protein KKG59_04175 [Nanoarchaeota archaeon]|nr:hypothetical protein [Nanoarchaeota archaeon]